MVKSRSVSSSTQMMYITPPKPLSLSERLDIGKVTTQLHLLNLKLTAIKEQNFKDVQSLKAKCALWLNAASPTPYIDQYLEDKTPGTCDWIRTHPSYTAWNFVPHDATSEERILQISGQPGCGKTMLACSIAQALGKEGKEVLFFSFSSADANRRTLLDLARAFVWQQLQQSGSEEAFRIIEELMSRGQPQSKDLWHALDQISAMGQRPLYWIVDALDECEDLVSTVFEKLLIFNIRRTSRGVVLGRLHAMEDLVSSAHTVKLTPDLVQTDIGAYIRSAIENSTTLHKFNLQDIAFDRLYDGSNGMFLWVKFMTDDLCRPCSIVELKERLYSLPKGLHKAYVRTLSRLIEPLDNFDREFMKNILALVISARRSLKAAELQHAVAMVQCAARQRPDAESLRDFLVEPFLERVRSVCGSLITIRHDILSVTHFSIEEFLTRPESEWCQAEEHHLLSIRLDLGMSHFLLGSACLDCLTMEGCKTSLNQSEQPDSVGQQLFLEYASGTMIYHLNRAWSCIDTAFYGRFEEFSASNTFLTWVSYLMTHSTDNDTAIWEFTEACIFVSCIEDDHLSKRIFSHMANSITGELETQREIYGCDDWRTKQLSAVADSLNLSIRNHTSDMVEFVQDVSSDVCEHEFTTDRLRIDQNDPKIKNITNRAFELLNVLRGTPSLPRRSQVVFNAQRGLRLLKPLASPLDVLCNALLHSAYKLPTFALLGVYRLFDQFEKYEMALEMCKIALAREDSRSGPLKSLAFGLKSNTEIELRRWADAERSQQQCAGEAKRIFGLEHSFTLHALDVWAARLKRVQNFKKSEEVLRLIISIKEKPHTPRLRSASKEPNEVALELPESDDRFRKSAKLSSLVVRVPDKDVLQSKLLLGQVLLAREQFVEAEDLVRQVFHGREKSLGKNDDSTVLALKGLAHVLQEQEKYAEAERHFRSVVEIETLKLGSECETTLQSMRALGHALREQKKYTSAEHVYRDVLETTKRAVGGSHPRMMYPTSDLGNVAFDQGHYEESIDLYREALEAAKSTSGERDLDTLIIERNLGSALGNVGEDEKAEVLLRKVLDKMKESRGADHEDTIESNRSLQLLLARLQPNGDEEESLQRELVEVSKRVHGAESQSTLNELVLLYWILYNRENLEEAAEIGRLVFEGRKETLGPDSTLTMDAAETLGLVYRRLNRFQDAADLFFHSVESNTRIYGREHEITVRSTLDLGEDLLALGKHKEAEDLFCQVLDTGERLSGEENENTVAARILLGRAIDGQKEQDEAAEL